MDESSCWTLGQCSVRGLGVAERGKKWRRHSSGGEALKGTLLGRRKMGKGEKEDKQNKLAEKEARYIMPVV